MGPAGFHLRDGRRLRRPPELRDRDRLPPAGIARLPGGDDCPAGVGRGLPALRRAEIRLVGDGRQHRFDGRALHRRQAEAFGRRLHPGREGGPPPRPRDDRLLQQDPRPLPRRADRHRRAGGVDAPLRPLRLLGGHGDALHFGRQPRRPAHLRHGGKADGAHRAGAGKGRARPRDPLQGGLLPSPISWGCPPTPCRWPPTPR